MPDPHILKSEWSSQNLRQKLTSDQKRTVIRGNSRKVSNMSPGKNSLLVFPNQNHVQPFSQTTSLPSEDRTIKPRVKQLTVWNSINKSIISRWWSTSLPALFLRKKDVEITSNEPGLAIHLIRKLSKWIPQWPRIPSRILGINRGYKQRVIKNSSRNTNMDKLFHVLQNISLIVPMNKDPNLVTDIRMHMYKTNLLVRTDGSSSFMGSRITTKETWCSLHKLTRVSKGFLSTMPWAFHIMKFVDIRKRVRQSQK